MCLETVLSVRRKRGGIEYPYVTLVFYFGIYTHLLNKECAEGTHLELRWGKLIPSYLWVVGSGLGECRKAWASNIGWRR